MTTRFEPFGDRLLVLPDAAPVKKGGLPEPPSQKDKAMTGVVVAVGPFATRRDEKDMLFFQRNSQGVCVGEHVQFPKYAGRDVMHMGEKHLLLRLEELDGRLVEVE